MAQDSYCMPIAQARLVFADALRKRSLDTLVHTQDIKIDLLTRQNFDTYNSLSEQLSIEREKLKVQVELTKHEKAIGQIYYEQAEHYRRTGKKRAIQRNVVTVAAVAVIILVAAVD